MKAYVSRGLLLIIVLSVLIAGCSGETPTGPTSSREQTNVTVTSTPVVLSTQTPASTYTPIPTPTYTPTPATYTSQAFHPTTGTKTLSCPAICPGARVNAYVRYSYHNTAWTGNIGLPATVNLGLDHEVTYSVDYGSKTVLFEFDPPDSDIWNWYVVEAVVQP